jgi:hypothetical protein
MQGLKVLVGLAVAGGLLMAAGPARAHDGCDNDRGSRYDGRRSGRVVYRSVDNRNYDGRYGRYDRRSDCDEALDRRQDRIHDRLEREHERAHELGFYSRYEHERYHEILDREHAREHRRLDRRYSERDCR